MSWFGLGGPKAGDPVEYPECPTPTSQAECTAILDKKLAELQTLASSNDGWTRIPLNEPELADVELYDREIPGSAITAVKVIATLNVSVEALVQLFRAYDVAVIQNWDADLLSLKQHRKFDEDTVINYSTYKAPYPLTSRALLVVKDFRKLPNGVAVVQTSINSKDFPYDPSVVRASLNISGLILTPVEGNPNMTRYVRVTQMDPKGNIPAMVVNLFKTKAAKNVASLRIYLAAKK